jgi:valyl-tRNA synthetase
LHPAVPFISEEIWQLLAAAAPARGLAAPAASAESIMIAPWPAAEQAHRDERIEMRFARFQSVLRGLREIRSRQNIPPKTPLEFSLCCDLATAELLRPMAPYFASLTGARAIACGPDAVAFATNVQMSLKEGELYVKLAGLIDVEAEESRLEKEKARLAGLIDAKKKKLANASFVERAPADVVAKERAALAELQGQLKNVEQALAGLRK